jgi:hypothetical protein
MRGTLRYRVMPENASEKQRKREQRHQNRKEQRKLNSRAAALGPSSFTGN